MTLAYVDAFSGVSGDMFLGALLDAGASPEAMSEAVGLLGVAGLRLDVAPARRSGIGCTKVAVTYAPQHEHRHLSQIVSAIEASNLPDPVKGQAIAVFLRLAEAEAAVHRVDPQKVHFHEVGAADALADVVGTVFGLYLLGVERVLAGSVNVGAGSARCEHGLLPVPAPATLRLLAGWTIHSAGPRRELTTPTGAALLTSLGTQVDTLPRLRLAAAGYGAGNADPEGWPNLLRIVIGEPADADPHTHAPVHQRESQRESQHGEAHHPDHAHHTTGQHA